MTNVNGSILSKILFPNWLDLWVILRPRYTHAEHYYWKFVYENPHALMYLVNIKCKYYLHLIFGTCHVVIHIQVIHNKL